MLGAGAGATATGRRCWRCPARTCRKCVHDASENLSAQGRLSPARRRAPPRKVVLIATGSEVEIAVDVADTLEAQGIGADVVSMPCWSRFDAQDARLSRRRAARATR